MDKTCDSLLFYFVAIFIQTHFWEGSGIKLCLVMLSVEKDNDFGIQKLMLCNFTCNYMEKHCSNQGCIA